MGNEELWLLKEKYGGEKTSGFFTDCARLKAGEPLAYIIGHIPFLDTTIYLDSHPLIPRPETEYWTSEVINRIEREHSDQGLASVRVLDLCAGSGCIGVAVLKALPQSHVDFVELDVSHHATIKKNVEKNVTDSTRARIFGGDLFEHITDTYDFILSNPPYIDPSLTRTEESVLVHEPHTALFGGKDGFELIGQIIIDAPRFLTETGTLILEHEPEQSEAIRVESAKAGLSATTHRDQFNVERYTQLTRAGIKNVSR